MDDIILYNLYLYNTHLKTKSKKCPTVSFAQILIQTRSHYIIYLVYYYLHDCISLKLSLQVPAIYHFINGKIMYNIINMYKYTACIILTSAHSNFVI